MSSVAVSYKIGRIKGDCDIMLDYLQRGKSLEIPMKHIAEKLEEIAELVGLSYEDVVKRRR